MTFLNKIIAKIKTRVYPKGHSRIKHGVGKNLKWKNQISDTRYQTGTYEPEIAQIIADHISNGCSFVDVGANAGYYTLIAAKYRKNLDQEIISIEPMINNLNLLNEHLELNNCHEIEVLNYAVSNERKIVNFSNTSNLAANTYNSKTNFYSNAPKIEIQSDTLDAICSNLKSKNILIKIDVEGAELDVLKGALQTILKYQPKIILATHDSHVPGIETECLQFLTELNYSCVIVDENKFIDGQQDYFCEIK